VASESHPLEHSQLPRIGNTFIDVRLSGVSRIGSRKRACLHQLQYRRQSGSWRRCLN
jgi:hypothetical protein